MYDHAQMSAIVKQFDVDLATKVNKGDIYEVRNILETKIT